MCAERVSPWDREVFSNRLLTEGIKWLLLEVDDNDTCDVLEGLGATAECIAEQRRRGKKTLVHCWAGVNRSAAIVVGYMAFYANMTLLEAFEQVVRCRGEVLTNWHFRELLVRAWVAKEHESDT